MSDVVLDVRGLRTRFGPNAGGVTAVDGVSLSLRRGRTTALVGRIRLRKVGDCVVHHAADRAAGPRRGW